MTTQPIPSEQNDESSATASATAYVPGMFQSTEEPRLMLAVESPAREPRSLIDETYHVARERVITEFERRYVVSLIERAGGNMSRAARTAGVDRTTLYRMMERHALRRNPSATWLVSRRQHRPEPAWAG